MTILSAELCLSTDTLLWPGSVVSVVTTLSHVLLTEDFLGWRLLGQGGAANRLNLLASLPTPTIQSMVSMQRLLPDSCFPLKKIVIFLFFFGCTSRIARPRFQIRDF